MGCFIACVAVPDSTIHPELQPDLKLILQSIDKLFEKRCEQARLAGELGKDVDATMLGQLMQGLLHTLAIRARAGQSRRSLNKLKSFAVNQWCAST